MSITRKLLKGMGLTDEQVDTIIEAHTETVDGLKADVSRYKTDAGKLAGVQKELDDLKAAGDGGYKAKYEKEHSDFEAFQSNITAKETKAAKEKAVRAFFESKNIQSIFACSIPKDLVILLRLVRKYDPILVCTILLLPILYCVNRTTSENRMIKRFFHSIFAIRCKRDAFHVQTDAIRYRSASLHCALRALEARLRRRAACNDIV